MNIYIAYDAVARVSNALSAAPAADASAAATHEALQAHVAQLLASWLRQSLAAEQWFTARVTVSYATMFYRHINKSAAVWTAAADGGDGASPQPKLILLQLLEDTVLLLLRHNPTSPAAPSSLSTGSKLINKKIGDKMVYSLNEWGPAQLIAIIINKVRSNF